MSEQDIVKACLQYLIMKHIFHYRQNTGAFKKENVGFYRFGTPGSPDIVAVIEGKYVGIEIKQPGCKQSPYQKEFEKNLKKAGGEYWLIYSIEELVLKLN